MCDKMEAVEDNLQKLEDKQWVSFLQMGIIGEGEGKSRYITVKVNGGKYGWESLWVIVNGESKICECEWEWLLVLVNVDDTKFEQQEWWLVSDSEWMWQWQRLTMTESVSLNSGDRELKLLQIIVTVSEGDSAQLDG